VPAGALPNFYMNIKGIGVDIIEVKRFRKIPYKKGSAFYQKVFTDREIKYCLSKSDPYPHFAARFAAKEAVAKAACLHVYKANKIEVYNDRDGHPLVRSRLIKGKILLSISHTQDHAIAFVIFTK